MDPTGQAEEPCPFCGLLIVWDYDAKRVHHEVPACRHYLDAINESGLKAEGFGPRPPRTERRR